MILNPEQCVLFWNGEFSQWHKSNFIIGDIPYNCAEQYMMAQKASLFNDIDSYIKIMKSKDPRDQKQYGREVKGFDVDIWNQNAKLIVYRANLAKFTQNYNLYTYISNTKDKIIIEASPYDKIWGIGMGAEDPNVYNTDLWQGKNWLGEVLMQVRQDISTLDVIMF